MNELRCRFCGSRNHQSLDCSKQHLTYVPTAADLAADAAEQVAVQEPPKPVAVAVAEPEPMFEAGERFHGCPQICTKTNLPAHASHEAADKFHSLNSPSSKVVNVGLCKACDKWHMSTIAPAPAGGSSGNERTSWSMLGALCGLRQMPAIPFRRKMRASSFADTAQEQLPQHEVAVDPEPKKVEFKPKKKVASKPLGGLFEATK